MGTRWMYLVGPFGVLEFELGVIKDPWNINLYIEVLQHLRLHSKSQASIISVTS